MSLDDMNSYEIEFWKKGCEDLIGEIEKCGLYICPECNHLMAGAPVDFNICTSCGKEFGYDGKERPDIQPVWKKEMTT